ncbi:MAG TPA: cupin domain-containing protein [Campylobacterales bacterium]|nr:cupin domain-containing protein [Campylobacterales bacterium]
MNLFDISQSSQEELFDTLTQTPNTRIERIVSYGQSSPDGFWYDQDEDEWVAVIEGGAEILFEREQAPVALGKGGTLFIPAHTKHRVTKTANPTIWLAVFMRS